MEFEHPQSVLNKVLAPVAKKYNERERKTTLENLKTIVEAQQEAKPTA
ncbi:hypothetical protein [Natronococcus wangiae]|nr:hypothetical protein [Natronococcus sp. AD5]